MKYTMMLFSILVLPIFFDSAHSQENNFKNFESNNKSRGNYSPFSSVNFSSELGCGIISSDKIIPENYNNFPSTSAGDWWIEQPFNTKIIRVTDSGEKFNTYAYHRYSSVCAFNYTGDYLITLHREGEVWLHDGRNGAPVKKLKITKTTCVWSMVEENLLYYAVENKLRSYNVMTDEDLLVREFTGESGIDFGGNEGDISNDGRYICFGSTNRTRWFVYDVLDDIKYEVLEVSGSNIIDAAQISPSGKYVVIEYAYAAANDYREGVGCCVHDAKTMAFIRNIYYNKTQHDDVGYDDDGDEALFIPDVLGDFSGAGPSAVLSIKLETGAKKVIHKYDTTTWTAYHFSQRSCLNRNDYVFSSSYTKDDTDPNSNSWKPYWHEILAIPTDTTKETVRLAHTRCNMHREKKWPLEPRASVNRQGDRIIFTSNLNGSNTWCDLFMITLEEPDTIPPLKPINLSLITNTYLQITLEWDKPNAAIDGDLPRNYKVYRDSTLVGYTRELTFTDTTVVENASYIYKVFSIDESAVLSDDCASIVVETGADTDPPKVIKVVSLGLNALAVHFDEELEIATALDSNNYIIGDGIDIKRLLLACKKVVLIATSEQNAGSNYTISIVNIRDASPNRNRIMGTLSEQFVADKGCEIAFNDFKDDFETAGSGNWQIKHAELWSYVTDQDRNVFGTNTGNYNYAGPGRLGTYALVKRKIFADFTMTCEVRSPDNGSGADLDFIWNYRDDYNYNYVMFNRVKRNNELFAVVDSVRHTLTSFGDFEDFDKFANEYHTVKVVAKSGHFTISLDDSIVVQGDDETFMYGRAGIGSFNDWVYFDNFSITVDKEFMTAVAAEPVSALSNIYILNQNYPNPFNPDTKIGYSLPKTEKVTLTIYNLHGQTIDIVIDEKQAAGNYQIIWNAGNLPSGIYFCELKVKGFCQKKKMLLLK